MEETLSGHMHRYLDHSTVKRWFSKHLWHCTLLMKDSVQHNEAFIRTWGNISWQLQDGTKLMQRLPNWLDQQWVHSNQVRWTNRSHFQDVLQKQRKTSPANPRGNWRTIKSVQCDPSSFFMRTVMCTCHAWRHRSVCSSSRLTVLNIHIDIGLCIWLWRRISGIEDFSIWGRRGFRLPTEINHKAISMSHMMNWLKINVQLSLSMENQAVKAIAKCLNLSLSDNVLSADDWCKGNSNCIHPQWWLCDRRRNWDQSRKPTRIQSLCQNQIKQNAGLVPIPRWRRLH